MWYQSSTTEIPDWYGNLVSQDDGSFLETNIPMHLDFIRKRKATHDRHFAQTARLLKFWAAQQKRNCEGFRFKSFMVELILAHLSDQGSSFDDYPEALQSFFTYIAGSDLRDLIIFADYYSSNSVPECRDRIQIIDPVNADNNVASPYSNSHAQQIVDASLDAGDAIDAALAAPTKGESVRYWRRVFGTSFDV